jgi:hypothetical protein
LRDAAALARWIVKEKPKDGIVNARDLRRAPAVAGCRDADRYEAALAELEAARWVRPAPSRASDRKGRQAKNWAVNPRVGDRS